MRYPSFLLLFFCLSAWTIATESQRLEEYYAKAVPNAESYAKRLHKNGQPERWPNLEVMALSGHARTLAMAALDLPEDKRPAPESIVAILQALEELQDKNTESPTFGNFRWYWRTEEVLDKNAVEFVMTHLLPIRLEANDRLSAEAREILERMMRRAVDGCISHRVRSDYTNITVYNFVHLTLLGQLFDRPDAIREAGNRIDDFVIHVWDHGVYEYNSPWYYPISVDSLELGFRYVKDPVTKETFRKLLDYFWTDLALHWYRPSLRHAGAQSRSYRYLLGTGDTTRLFEFVGLAPPNLKSTSWTYMNSFRAVYRPDSKILALNQKYPRLLQSRWGREAGQWATAYLLDDIALGTAGAIYRSRQNMTLTVDLADYDTMPTTPPPLLPRNYFIPDGREDPYGVNRFSTSDGHNKALHMQAFWMGAQRTCDALGVVLYTPESLKESVLTNVQSHFVFRKPDAIILGDKTIELPTNEKVEIDKLSVFFRYGTKAFGIRVLWTRDKNSQSPKAYLIDDGNKQGVYRLTIDHWPKGTPVSPDGLSRFPGAAFWLRIGSHLDSDTKFNAWKRRFAEAKVERQEIYGKNGDSIAIQVAGIDGPVAVNGFDLASSSSRITTNPAGPSGILMLDGHDLGRPLLADIPAIKHLRQRMGDLKPIPVKPAGTSWEAETGFSFSESVFEKDAGASGGQMVRVNSDISWQLDIKKKGDYYLWAHVLATDMDHDSFSIDWVKTSGNTTSLSAGGKGAWHLGIGPTWRWVYLSFDNKKEPVRMKLDQGTWRLTLRPRERDGLVDKFFLTTDPKAKPK